MKSFFLTTAIDYVNSIPHIGTAYEKIGADILARYHRMKGDVVWFQMGNDEHSVNVKKAAENEKLSPKAYCDGMRPKFESVWQKLSLSYNHFIQTSDPRHHEAVKKLFQRIYENGDIYEGDYEGLYCESCEAFYTEKDLTDGLCPQHQKPPTHIKEKNFFFKLSKYADVLLEYIEKHPHFILPAIRRNEIVNVIKGGLKDVSVSRSGFDWGIPLPLKSNHVVYVWFDALINYITLIGYADDEANFKKWWPVNMHIIGKDITRFHCVIWPAMLMSAGIALPQTIFGHGFVYLKGEKMSKSLGNVVTPLDVIDQFGPDALRYYLVRGNSFGDDGNFSWDDFILRYNSDLANGLGNLVSRTAGMINRYFEGVLPVKSLTGSDLDLATKKEQIINKVDQLLDPAKEGDIYFNRALENIWAYISELDKYIDAQAPWTLAKEKKMDRLGEVLTTIARSLFNVCALIKPFIPETAHKIWDLYGWQDKIPFDELNFDAATWRDDLGVCIKKGAPALFPRIQIADQKS
ncbi:MAG: hypothetical protein ACD_73C00046G0004 [uncultured bacterium]|nr:MAG: hypothetical protein ACD_73C00046G0004 [uncultured bacterium]